MAKAKQLSRANRVLKENQAKGSVGRRPKSFYALVDVTVEDKINKKHEIKTVVIGGTSRRDAYNNALIEISLAGWKAKITDVRPTAV